MPTTAHPNKAPHGGAVAKGSHAADARLASVLILKSPLALVWLLNQSSIDQGSRETPWDEQR